MAKNANSQNAKVTINKQDVRLESILSEIESQTNYLFIYKKCRCKFAQKHQREAPDRFLKYCPYYYMNLLLFIK